MTASRGPIPKRSETRRRTNASPDGLGITTAPGAENIVMPEPNEDWHDIAYDWYLSLGESGQAQFYEPSDWMTAYMLAQIISDQFGEHYIGMRVVGAGGISEPYFGREAITGSTLAGLLKGMANLGVTEGDRRRMRIELVHGEPAPPETAANVRAISSARSALGVS